MTRKHDRPARTAGAGTSDGLWFFAAVMLLLAGVLDLLRGVMGIAGDDVFVAAPHYVFGFTLTAWGWIHLALGVLGVLVALGLFRRERWGRVAGVAVAVFLVVASFLSLPYSPLWSVVVIVLAAFVVWALCGGGRPRGH
ncbi:hypothetical protein [Streptomyces sp. NPDC056600]|uniref:DUF7144 family membrane protein n=1 Tax=Streptomyces sp. NPDC056600 TaxID=3345874 RepID=UPI0036ACFEF2